MINDKADEVIEKTFQSLCSICHKINPNWGGSYVDLEWIKSRKSNNKSHQ